MKKRILFFLLLLTFGILLLSACDTARVTGTKPPESTDSPESTSTIAVQDSHPISPGVTLLSPEDAKKMMDAGGVIIVDVRRADEYASGHIPGAILLPNETIAETAEEVLTDKSAVILVYCRSGRRSAEAAEKLLALGYTSVYDFGGILDWHYEITTE